MIFLVMALLISSLIPMNDSRKCWLAISNVICIANIPQGKAVFSVTLNLYSQIFLWLFLYNISNYKLDVHLAGTKTKQFHFSELDPPNTVFKLKPADSRHLRGVCCISEYIRLFENMQRQQCNTCM